jgi:hypothetical protein
MDRRSRKIECFFLARDPIPPKPTRPRMSNGSKREYHVSLISLSYHQRPLAP